MLKSIAFAAVVAMSTCRQSGTVQPPGGCQQGATECREDRPYACGNNVWRPIGDGVCSSYGENVTCCRSQSGVAACLPSSACEVRDE